MAELIETPNEFDIYVTEKRAPTMEKGVVKDGLHLAAPSIITNPALQLLLRFDAARKAEDTAAIREIVAARRGVDRTDELSSAYLTAAADAMDQEAEEHRAAAEGLRANMGIPPILVSPSVEIKDTAGDRNGATERALGWLRCKTMEIKMVLDLSLECKLISQCTAKCMRDVRFLQGNVFDGLA